MGRNRVHGSPPFENFAVGFFVLISCGCRAIIVFLVEKSEKTADFGR